MARFLFFDTIEKEHTPPRCLGQEKNASRKHRRPNGLDGKWESPLRPAGVDKVKTQPHPAGGRITNAQHHAMHGDEEASNLGWSDLALVKRNQCDKSA